MSLPKHFKRVNNDKYRIDADTLYPMLLDELAEERDRLPPKKDDEEPHIAALRSFQRYDLDQYWLEVIYQFAKLDLRLALRSERASAWPAEIHIDADKQVWRIAQYPRGRGVEAASEEGKEARKLYKYMRGFIPN